MYELEASDKGAAPRKFPMVLTQLEWVVLICHIRAGLDFWSQTRYRCATRPPLGQGSTSDLGSKGVVSKDHAEDQSSLKEEDVQPKYRVTCDICQMEIS